MVVELMSGSGSSARQGLRWRLYALALAVFFLAAVAACGKESIPTATTEPTAEPVPEETAEDILLRAVQQLLVLESTAFTLEQLTGTTKLFSGLDMTKASGMVEVPGKAQVKIEAETTSPHSYVELEIITIGQDAYMTDLLTGRWLQVPQEILPFTLHDIATTLADIVGNVQTPELVGIELLDGVETYRISGAVKSQDLSGIVPGAGTDFDVGVELWLDHPQALLRQAVITGKVVASDVPEAVRRLTLEDINAPVDITPPG